MVHGFSSTGLNFLLEHLRSPWPTWLLLLSGLVIFSPLMEGGTTHLAVMILRLIVLVLLSLYVWRGIQAGALASPSMRVGPAVLTYVGLAAVSTASSPYTHQSLQWLLLLASYVGLLFLLVSFLRGWDDVAKLLAVLFGMGLLEAGLTLFQGSWLQEARPTGTFFNPNFLAGYLAAVWALLLGSLCHTRGLWRHRWKLRTVRWSNLIPQIVSVAGLGGLLLAIVSTGSRGGVLAMLAGTSLVVGLRFGRRGLVLLLLLFLSVLLLASPLRSRLQAEHAVNPLGYARWQIWQSSAQAMAEHPFGVGLGLYQYVYPRYAFPVEGQIARYGKLARRAHNEYVQMGVELGILSIPIFCWGVVGVAREAGSVLRQRLRRWQRGVVVGASGAVAGILAHAAVDSNLHAPALAVLLTFCAGIILAARRLSSPAIEPVRIIPISSKWIWTGVTLAVVLGLGVIVTRLGFAWVAFESGSGAAARQEYSRAVAAYGTAIALDPRKALYHSSLAAEHFRAFKRTGDAALGQASAAELESAIALNPLDGRLLGRLGHVYRSMSVSGTGSESSGNDPSGRQAGWQRSARAAYERAAELEPFYPFYLLELGRLYFASGEPDRAEATVRRAVQMEPNFLPGREWLARLYVDLEQSEAATREYREIIERQERYADWTKGAVEEQFLKADVTTLKAALERAGART